MDTHELLRPQQLVGKIKHVILEELDEVDASVTSPEERNTSLLESFENRKPEFQLGPRNLSGFAVNALEDMWLISRGAFNYLELNNDSRDKLEENPLDTVIRSAHDLSFPALIPTDSWERIKNSWKIARIGEVKKIPEKKFQLRKNSLGLQIVGFSSGALTEIDSCIDTIGESGCPAYGSLLSGVFGRYIEVVYSDTDLINGIES